MALVICYEFLAVGCSILKLLVLFLGAGLFSLVGLSDAFWIYLSVMLAWTLTSLKSTVQSIPIFRVVLHINQNAARRGRQMWDVNFAKIKDVWWCYVPLCVVPISVYSLKEQENQRQLGKMYFLSSHVLVDWKCILFSFNVGSLFNGNAWTQMQPTIYSSVQGKWIWGKVMEK